MPKKLKALPKFRTEAAERRFWEKHDSIGYVDWDKAERARLPNLKPTLHDARKGHKAPRIVVQ